MRIQYPQKQKRDKLKSGLKLKIMRRDVVILGELTGRVWRYVSMILDTP
jgi:hypothetical protein